MEDYVPKYSPSEAFRRDLARLKVQHRASTEDLAATFTVSPRTVEGWLQERNPNASVYAIMKLLKSGKIPIIRARQVPAKPRGRR